MERGITYSDRGKPLTVTPELALIYKTAPIGLAFLRYRLPLPDDK